MARSSSINSGWHSKPPKAKSRLERRREQVLAESKKRYFDRSRGIEDNDIEEEEVDWQDGWR